MNRLVTSACETFVSAPLKDGGKEVSPEGGTPNSTSPSLSSRPGSGLNGDLSQMVSAVTRRAEAIANQAYARRKKFQKSMTHPHSRSYGNLIELQEDEEDEMVRKDRLKFPSDCAIDSTYCQLLENKEEALHALRRLVRASREVERSPRHEEGPVVSGDLESSLSEPDLHRGM